MQLKLGSASKSKHLYRLHSSKAAISHTCIRAVSHEAAANLEHRMTCCSQLVQVKHQSREMYAAPLSHHTTVKGHGAQCPQTQLPSASHSFNTGVSNASTRDAI